MKRSGIRKNNRGDTLILVIGCIAMLSLLGVVILAKAMDNRNMKVTEEQAQYTFFKADSSSAEMTTILEAMAHDAVEAAFSDMMLEYSLIQSGQDRAIRYSDYFAEAFKRELNAEGFQDRLETALGGEITELSVSGGNVVETVSTLPADPSITRSETDIIKIKDLSFTYTLNGSKSKVTTDICVQAKVPNVEAGFRIDVDCDFSDFALITDGSTNVTAVEELKVNGNVYVGEELRSVGSSVGVDIKDATKILVRGEMQIEGGAKIKLSNGSVTLTDGQGVWANGIYVRGGKLDATNVNFYVRDDMTIEGSRSEVYMQGADASYVGYSNSTPGLSPHLQNSAITINKAEDIMLDLSSLGKLMINGNSYIRDKEWEERTDGVMQGESVAYKDMQTMYLVPGNCLSVGHNPVLGEDTSFTMDPVYNYQCADGTMGSFDFGPYLNPTEKYVVRTMIVDGTHTKYVYMNFKNKEMAAKFVTDFLNTDAGDEIKSRITNLNKTINSIIKLPPADKTKTLANALTYDGTNVSMIPAVDASQRGILDTTSLIARQRYAALFTSLGTMGGINVPADYKLVKKAVLVDGAFDDLTPGQVVEKSVADPLSPGLTYTFALYNGDVIISGGADNNFLHSGMNGILLVNGTVTVKASNTQIGGLVVATEGVNVEAGATFTANSRAVEVLLEQPEVGYYFRGYSQDSDDGYLSTESVDVTFENWRKN